jgi:peroxiredoxin
MSVVKNSLFIFLLAFITGPAWAGQVRTAIHSSADEAQPLLPGMKAPAFTVRDVSGNAVSFEPDTLHKPLVLTFYRGGWCPYCNLHLAEMRKAEAELNQMGFDIWFISMDRPEKLVDSLEQSELAYTLLSDASLEAVRAFGIAFRVPDDLVEKYLGFGIDLEDASGESHHVLPVPSTFLIGEDGRIRFQYTNTDYKVRLYPEVLLAAARAYLDDSDTRLERQRQANRER